MKISRSEGFFGLMRGKLKMSRRLILSLIPLLAIILVPFWIYSSRQGHLDLPQSYRSADGSLTFQYPQGWFATNLSGERVDLENTPYEKRVDSPDAIRLEISP